MISTKMTRDGYDYELIYKFVHQNSPTLEISTKTKHITASITFDSVYEKWIIHTFPLIQQSGFNTFDGALNAAITNLAKKLRKEDNTAKQILSAHRDAVESLQKLQQ